jgi:hypothetical protein
VADLQLGQLPIEVGVQGTSSAQLAQLPIEVAVSPTPAMQLGQLPIEVAIVRFIDNHALLAQLPIEVAVIPVEGIETDLTQLGAEVFHTTHATADLTAVAVELWNGKIASAAANMTSMIVEVFYPLLPVEPPLPENVDRRYIRRLRRATHLSAEEAQVFYELLTLDIETGVGKTVGQGSDPQVMLRWSDDGGHTWSDEVWVSAGGQGAYQWQALWRRLGRSRDRVFEISMSDPVRWTLLGAYLELRKGAH